MLSVTTGIAADAASAEEHGRAAIDLAEQAGDPVLLAQALGALATMEFMLGRGVDRTRWERALELEAECGDRLWIDVMPSVQFGRVLFWTGELADARRIFERLRSIALERGDASRASLEWCLGYVGVRAGDWRWAADRADAALELTKQSGREADAAPFLALKAWVEAHVGRIDEARADAAAAIADATATRQPGAVIQARSALGFLELSLGDPVAALEQLDQADALAQATGVEDPGMYPYVTDRVEALTTLRRLGEAEALLEPFESKGRNLDRAWVLATSARCCGFLAATRGQRDAAVSAFEDSLGEQERSEQPLERGRTLLLYGAAERRFQQRRAARALLQSALDLFVELGAPLWAERARNELLIVGGRAASPGSLTDMERRIAVLVAAGNSNQQVANALHVAPKTVEWNLSKVYRKLRVHSRTELAAKLAKKARAG
jgi:DNA-binding CsgD family transcriptional regulator